MHGETHRVEAGISRTPKGNCGTKIILLLWGSAWVCLSLITQGCGGGGGDDSDLGDNVSGSSPAIVAAKPTPTPAPSVQCEHDGAVYLCNDNSCIPDATSEIVAVEEPESNGEVTEDALGQTTFKSISIGGSVTIIAECGSNVNFDLSESTVTPPAPPIVDSTGETA